MLEKLKNEEGFLLLESFVSLTLITLGLVILLPAITQFYSMREEEKNEVEMYRLMYDSAIVWEGENKNSQEQYGEWTFDVSTDQEGILVSGPKGVNKQVELKTIDFQR